MSSRKLCVCFRADASVRIGSGHVMRCLTLANALRARGAECRFICREHPGHLISQIEAKGFPVIRLPLFAEIPGRPQKPAGFPHTAHHAWLGNSPEQDAAECARHLASSPVDWLIVDHYALEAAWETALRPYCRQIMVIDDLADRAHRCAVLLDQNLGRTEAAYQALLPSTCRILTGPQHALLRPEFAAWRVASLARREQACVSNERPLQLLINLGGVDLANDSERILATLTPEMLPPNTRITVILGPSAPHRKAVEQRSQDLHWPCTVIVGANNMGELLSQADLAIGAAGSSTWERCCLGLPTLALVLADNQRGIAAALAAHTGLASAGEDLAASLQQFFQQLRSPEERLAHSRRVAELVDGRGCERVADLLIATGDPG